MQPGHLLLCPVDKTKFNQPYMRLVIAAGIVAVAVAALRLDTSVIDIRFLILFSFTTLVGSRIGIQIPKTQAEITVSDTFVFLALLLYSGEAAILLAASEAFCSSLRFSRKWITRLFNAALLALSTTATVWLLRLTFGTTHQMIGDTYEQTFPLAVLLMGTVQYAFNSGLAALRDSLKLNRSLWQIWRNHYLWTSITYFAGASTAAVIAKLIGGMGHYAFAAGIPIVAIIYFTYQTYRKNIEAAERFGRELQESEAHFRGAFDHAAIGMALVGLDGRWLRVNDSLCRLIGYSSEELLAMRYQDVTHPHDLSANETQAVALLEGTTPSFQLEKRYVHKQGDAVWVTLSVSLVRTAAGEPIHFIKQVQDITDRKRAEQQLQHDAFHDGLTGLPNRALFMDHLSHAVARASRRSDFHFAVLFLDCDRFKVINDSLGHLLGDELLIEMAARLRSCVREIDSIARLGGDEFTILLEDISHPIDTEEILGRIQEALMQPFELGGHEVFTSASIGVAPSITGYERAEDILRDADTAMYRAKHQGKARYVMFDRSMHESATKLLQVETDLRRAVERGEFLLHYQPIVSLATEEITGFEALVRWQHPVLGMISPLDFIPVAEETGMIVQIGRWVIREACRQMREWQMLSAAAGKLFVSVNISGKQFSQPELVQEIVAIVREAGIDARSVKAEVTESLLMENMEVASAKLEELRQFGIEVSIDDFGTGYSSLSYLHRLPIDTLKIDRSFVMRMNGNDENTEIVRTVVTLARSLEMKVVAEGVETGEQKTLLQALQCDSGQGYLFSQPLEASAVSKLLSDKATLLDDIILTTASLPASDVEVAATEYAM